MSRSHHHDPSSGTQNQGNSLGDRSCVRQSKLFRMYESGNDVKNILGMGNLVWKTNVKEGAYQGQKIFDHTAVNQSQSQSVNGGYTTGNGHGSGGNSSLPNYRSGKNINTSSNNNYKYNYNYNTNNNKTAAHGDQTRSIQQQSSVIARGERNYNHSQQHNNKNDNEDAPALGSLRSEERYRLTNYSPNHSTKHDNDNNNSDNNNYSSSNNNTINNLGHSVNVRVIRPTYDPSVQPTDLFVKPKVTISYVNDEQGVSGVDYYEGKNNDYAHHTVGSRTHSNARLSPEQRVMLDETRIYNAQMQMQLQQQQQQQQQLPHVNKQNNNNDYILKFSSNMGQSTQYPQNRARVGGGKTDDKNAVLKSPPDNDIVPKNHRQKEQYRDTRPW